MLDISASKVAQIILLAKKYDAKVGPWTDAPIDANATEDPDSILEDFNSDATTSELAQFIGALNVDEQINLVALVWVGRGTYSADQFDEAVQTAAQERINPTQNYLMGMPLLADHLAEGLEKMSGSAIAAEEDLLGFEETKEAPEV
jgi:hypothetical protein